MDNTQKAKSIFAKLLIVMYNGINTYYGGKQMKFRNKLPQIIEEMGYNKSSAYNEIEEVQPKIEFWLNNTIFQEYFEKDNGSAAETYRNISNHYGNNVSFGIRTFQKMVNNNSWQRGANLKEGKLKTLLIIGDVLGLSLSDFLQIREVPNEFVNKPSQRTFYKIVQSDLTDFSIIKLWPIMGFLGLGIEHIDSLFEIIKEDNECFNQTEEGWVISPHISDPSFGNFINKLIARFDKPFSLSVKVYNPLPSEMTLIEKLALHNRSSKHLNGDKVLGLYSEELAKKVKTSLLSRLDIWFVSTMADKQTLIKLEAI